MSLLVSPCHSLVELEQIGCKFPRYHTNTHANAMKSENPIRRSFFFSRLLLVFCNGRCHTHNLHTSNRLYWNRWAIGCIKSVNEKRRWMSELRSKLKKNALKKNKFHSTSDNTENMKIGNCFLVKEYDRIAREESHISNPNMKLNFCNFSYY